MTEATRPATPDPTAKSTSSTRYLREDTTGTWRVTTETHTYFLDLDARTFQMASAHPELPAVRLLEFVGAAVGRPMMAMLQFPHQLHPQTWRTANVVSIERVS